MELLKRLGRWITRREKATGFSTPEQAMRAASILEQNGQLMEASVLLSEALKQFPQATALRGQRERVERRWMRERIAELVHSLASRPDPALAVELIRLYQRTGDTVSARRVSAEAIEKFPDHPLLHQVTGELWMDIFEESGSSQDGLAALEYLERCICLDASNVPAREMLIRLYGKIGAWKKALHHAVRVLAFTRPAPIGQIALEAFMRQGGAEEDAVALMRKYVRQSETVEKKRAASPTPEKVTQILGLLQDLKGRKAVAVVAGDGLLIQGLLSADVDRDLLAAAVHGLTSAASDCCSRMSLGAFAQAELGTPEVTAYLKAILAEEPRLEAPSYAGSVFVMAEDTAQRREILARLEKI